MLIGVLLLLLGIRQWRSRPAPGVEAELPAWMSKIDSMRAFAALGLGFALAAINPKNLLAAGATGAVVGRAGFDAGSTTIVIGCFSVLAAFTVIVPVTIAIVAPAKAAKVLASVRTWLSANNATIMTVLFVVLGAQVLGKGIGSF